MTEIDLAYMAGFVDGEGCIGISKRKRKHWNIEYNISLTIGQKDGATMDWIGENFGGFVHHVKRDGSFMWLTSYQEAYKTLKLITPYLKYKKPQALIAIKFYEETDKRRPIPQKELQRREELFLEIRRLKRVFTTSTYHK